MRTKGAFALVSLALTVLAAFTLRTGAGAHRSVAAPVAPLESALVTDPGPCSLSPADARAWASDTHRKARARWERVWYATSEGPQAVLELMRAMACFRMLGDREARAAAERDLTRWQHELRRRYARARLDLTLALRADDPLRVIRETTRIAQLLSQAGSSADPYRAHLRQLEREARARRFERKTTRQEQ